MAELTLPGLDGTNPLAFFATLGVLEAVRGQEGARLHWRYEGGWRPVLTSSHASFDTLVERLDKDRMSCLSDPALGLTYDGKRDLKPPPAVFREYLAQLLLGASPTQRGSIDWASSFATDVAVDNNGNTKPTALHFTAGQQQFLQMALQLVKDVTPDDLREAVVGPWSYGRPLPVMGWDATSARDYALRASDPSTDKKRGVPGADWLALRGLVLLPVMPSGSRAYTTGCTGGWKNGWFVWPIWTVPLQYSVVRTVMAQRVAALEVAQRRALGISAVFEAAIRRHETGGRGSFEPATPA